MFRWKTPFTRTLSFFLPLAAGVGVLLLAQALRAVPDEAARQAQARPVRFITLTEGVITPRVTGYGAVSPAREWRAIARVEGEIVWTAPDLANGRTVTSGTELIRLDDSDIRLTLAQLDAQMSSLDTRDETTRSALAIEEEDLALSRAELERQRQLSSRGVATQSAVDQAERQELASRSKVNNLHNQLALNAAERAVLQAQRQISERNLEHVSIKAPYDLRIGEVQAEIGQFVNRGQTLFSAEGTEAVEIAAQFPIGRLGPLVSERSVANEAANRGETGPLGLSAVVRLQAPGHSIEWDAKVNRVGDTIDPRTQSATVIVRVDNPTGQARAGARPPLRRNIFVEVTLSAAPRPALLAPLSALRDGKAMVIAEDNTLAFRQVTLAYRLDDFAVIGSGLAAGDRLIVSDLDAPVSGMALKPVEDKALEALLAAEGTTESPVTETGGEQPQ